LIFISYVPFAVLCISRPWLRFFYPDWGLSTLTEVYLPWLRFFYPDWGFSTLTEVFLPWLRFLYPDWGFSTLTEVYLPWLRFFRPDWGFSALTEVFLPWLRFFYPDWGFSTLNEVFPPFFLSCKANARIKPAKTGHGQHSSKFVVWVVLFVILIVLLLIVMFYVLFVCKCVLPPGVNPNAVDRYIISYQMNLPDTYEAYTPNTHWKWTVIWQQLEHCSLLRTKHNLSYTKSQCVPRSKYFPSRL
jgi:hypothetical protein